MPDPTGQASPGHGGLGGGHPGQHSHRAHTLSGRGGLGDGHVGQRSHGALTRVDFHSLLSYGLRGWWWP